MFKRYQLGSLLRQRVVPLVLCMALILQASPVMAGPAQDAVRRQAVVRPAPAAVVNVAAPVPAPIAPAIQSTPQPRLSVEVASPVDHGLYAAPIGSSHRPRLQAQGLASTTPVPPRQAGPPRFAGVPTELVPPGAEHLLNTGEYRRRFARAVFSTGQVPLVSGWNLVSLAEEPAGTAPADVLASIAGSYNVVYAYDGCDAADPWKMYDPSDPGNSDLTALDTSKGFWIEMTAADTLDVGGTPPTNVTIPLCVGWNLIGYPFDQSLPVRGALRPIEGQYSRVFAYNPSAPTDPWLGYRILAPGYANDLALMEPGHGYWIYATENTTLTIQGPGAPPTVTIDDPLEGVELTTFTGITGTVSSGDVERWVLEHRYADNGVWTEFAAGEGEMSAGLLGTFDPTLLLNGIYRLRLTATDVYGQRASDEIDVLVDGQLKIGLFTLSFVDLAVPVSGIPIEIVRTYDSRDKRQHDFGVGWTLDIRSGSYTNNRKPGDGWFITSSGGLFNFPCSISNESKYHVTEIRFSDVEYYRFAARVQMYGLSSVITGGCQGDLVFEQIGGLPGAQLDIIGDPSVIWNSGGDQVYELDGVTVAEPDDVRLTTIDGRMFDLNLQEGLYRVEDLNSNSLFIDENGVTHSSGKSISFTRDAEGRIVTITDPMGNGIGYAYDERGDLVRQTDRLEQASRYTYDSFHNLLDIFDSADRLAVRTEYDGEGRMISTTDPVGNRLEFTHKLADNQEIVRDRLGYPTIYEYDERGNVVAEINALNQTTLYTYDQNDNQLSETDALGNTTTYTYNDKNRIVTQTDAAGNTISYTYDSANRLRSMTEPLGLTTLYTYNTSGQLSASSDPNGDVTRYTYDAAGNRTSVTDADGNVTRYEYDAFGNRTREIDALGVATTYTYDANGNPLTEATTQSTPAGVRTLLTSRTYDANGNVLSVTNPAGETTNFTYDVYGNQIAAVAANGNRNERSYNHHRQLATFTYADSGTNEFAYDAEGRRTGATNREGETTIFAYDAVGKPRSMVFVDDTPGDFTDNPKINVEYDTAGRMTALIDEQGNRTEFEYGTAGQFAIVRDPLGNETRSTYDAAGREIARTDALNRTTEFVYDNSSRLIQTIYPDGTSTQIRYDSRDNVIAELDQGGRETVYEYDGLDRLGP